MSTGSFKVKPETRSNKGVRTFFIYDARLDKKIGEYQTSGNESLFDIPRLWREWTDCKRPHLKIVEVTPRYQKEAQREAH